ncbi:hypothetical protein K4749_37840 [Streptomyces sp. TRM72054]|uniref:hypothetical protein n=1 Tax=Streptomyces sp. TRM72054 TaxID=2870562 RepID=UPI001C8C0FD1|nr:hypothetical protein [Streptomyces sp. TRM72054]MBX9399184.1 hypothetical protein [Streptomyces sp. TRM72054]
MLIRSIERLWQEVEILNRPVVRFRGPGVSASEVEAAFENPVPEDIVTWFGWSNGVEYHPGQVQDDAALVPGYEPLSLPEARAVRDSYQIDDPVLGEFFVPLLATGGGDFYAAVYDASLQAPSVAHVMIGGETKLVYESVEGMVNAFCDFYRTGVFFVSDQGILEADDYRWVEAESGSGPTA